MEVTVRRKTFLIALVTAILLPVSGQLDAQTARRWPERSVTVHTAITQREGLHTTPVGAEMLWHGNRLHHGIMAGFKMAHYESFSSGHGGPFASYTLLTGMGTSHVELSVGITTLGNQLYGSEEYEPEEDGVAPMFSVGYRYQSPYGRLIFRVFAGYTGVGAGIAVRIADL